MISEYWVIVVLVAMAIDLAWIVTLLRAGKRPSPKCRLYTFATGKAGGPKNK